jgi:hypothetical protein
VKISRKQLIDISLAILYALPNTYTIACVIS